MREALWVVVAAVLVALIMLIRYAVRGQRHLGTPTQRASYQALHTANLAAPPLRAGLTTEGAGHAVGYLRALLGVPGLVIADLDGVLAADGLDAEHRALIAAHVNGVTHPKVLPPADLLCGRGSACELQAGVVVPLEVDGTVVGALAALDNAAAAGLLRLCGEVARFVSTQLELAELDRSRARATQAELQFLRAQISPHFVYNALTAIESFVRSDPERARELLIGFADFTRYSFRTHGPFTTLAEELRLVDVYLDLERARFGDRFSVTLRVAPEVLSVRVPSLILQPIVENALAHGLEPRRSGHLDITVADNDSEALVSVDDNGVGAEPRRVRRILTGTSGTDAVGLRNVDERLRATFGDEFGLLVETGLNAGTRVTMRIPKFSPVVQAS
ncbi:MAG: histidine kinase [Acidimicrobiaceae bacterium]|nr:histidine kinase [Acidimicrobiaceae bacterium]